MSKSKPPKKRVVTTQRNEELVPTPESTSKKRISPTVTRTRVRSSSTTQREAVLVFGRQNYILMGVGIGLIFLGMLLMTGGSMPSPDVWDPSIIYSFRRTVLAPIVILAGLVVEIFAIFKKQ